jgi:hypothetical protein
VVVNLDVPFETIIDRIKVKTSFGRTMRFGLELIAKTLMIAKDHL